MGEGTVRDLLCAITKEKAEEPDSSAFLVAQTPILCPFAPCTGRDRTDRFADSNCSSDRETTFAYGNGRYGGLRIRTCGAAVNSRLLCLLSYAPTKNTRIRFIRRCGHRFSNERIGRWNYVIVRKVMPQPIFPVFFVKYSNLLNSKLPKTDVSVYALVSACFALRTDIIVSTSLPTDSD